MRASVGRSDGPSGEGWRGGEARGEWAVGLSTGVGVGAVKEGGGAGLRDGQASSQGVTNPGGEH